MCRRLSGAQFRNVSEVALLEENEITPQSLQVRYLIAAQTVDLLERTMREILTTERGIIFNTSELRHATDLGIFSLLLTEADPSLLMLDKEMRPGVRETRVRFADNTFTFIEIREMKKIHPHPNEERDILQPPNSARIITKRGQLIKLLKMDIAAADKHTIQERPQTLSKSQQLVVNMVGLEDYSTVRDTLLRSARRKPKN